LGYSNTSKTIKDHVDDDDRCILQNTSTNDSLYLKNQGNSILINESGLYSLILRSNKPESKQFKKWVTSVVLPSIRKNRMSIVNNTEKQIKTNEMLDMVKLFDVIKTANLDDRDRLMFLDYSRNLFLDVPSNCLQIKNENSEWSVSRRLKDKYNVPHTKQIKSMSMTFGKILCKEYKKLYNNPPPSREQFVDGTVRSVKCYFEKDWLEFGDVLLEQYFNMFLPKD
jgi:prophage antirepressor-like protein